MIVPTHASARVHAHTDTAAGGGGGGHLPAIATGFVRKLYRILDQESGAVISWTRNGTAFAIYDDERLNELILPRYFRGRLCAFRQQLREHGFQQLLPGGAAVPIAPVAPLHQPQLCTYAHEHFVRGSPERLCKIARTPLPRRRLSSRKSKAASAKRTAAAAAAASTVSAPAAADASNKRVRTASSASSASSFSASPSSSSSSLTCSSSSASSSSLSVSALDSTANSRSAAPRVPYSQPMHPPPHQPPPSPSSHPLQLFAQPALTRKNPLFSTESDASFGDWLSLNDDIAPALGGAGVGVTADIAFSEDMLGALMTLVSNSMTSVSPTSACGSSAGSVAAVSATSAANSYAATLTPAALAKKAAAAGPTLYETHQFSDDTLNSMLLWLGTGSST